MISRILIIASGGNLWYSKNFITKDLEDDIANNDLMNDFLIIISNFEQGIKAGAIKTLNFRNFNFICSYDEEFDCIFIIVTDVDDLEEVGRKIVELIKSEFIKRYRHILEDFNGDDSKFLDFDEFVDEHISIPPKILLIGEIGVGKSTIMNLFPGETVIEIDEDLNEIIEKSIRISGLEKLKQFKLRDIDIVDLVDKPKLYKRLLDRVDIICIVTNSAASNLGRTKKYFSRLKPLVKKADFYIIANFQDSKESAFEPDKIEESFGIKTYGYSAIQEDSKEKIVSIFNEILTTSILFRQIKSEQLETTQLPKVEDIQKLSQSLSQGPKALGVGHNVFICYSSNDKGVADAACHFLEQQGIKCWIAPRDVSAGSYASSIVEAIEKSKLMVFIFTNSANFSHHVKRELDLAVTNGITIQPIRTEDVEPTPELKYYLSSIHWLDALTPPLEEHLSKLAEMVSQLLKVL